MAIIGNEQEKRTERIAALQTSIQNKDDAMRKRDERHAKQKEIALAAANESNDKSEKDLMDRFLI